MPSTVTIGGTSVLKQPKVFVTPQTQLELELIVVFRREGRGDGAEQVRAETLTRRAN